MGVTLVISTHLDDAVFSVGQLLAGSDDVVVATMFAGVPAAEVLDAYDRACGFASSEHAMRHRRREDETALAMLGAKAVHLDLFGVQYGPHGEQEIADAIEATVSQLGPDLVVGPVGLVHPDHERVGAAWPRALRRYPGIARYAYEDLPYRLTFPRRSRRAIRAFVDDHRATEAVLPAGDRGAKACAMLAYTSQLRTATPLKCLEPERLWLLADRVEDA